MKVTEFLKELIKSNSGYSSKRFSALILISFSIIIPLISMIINNPVGSIDDSVLILSAQMLVSACGLLGFAMKENISERLRPNSNKPEVNKTKVDG